MIKTIHFLIRFIHINIEYYMKSLFFSGFEVQIIATFTGILWTL